MTAKKFSRKELLQKFLLGTGLATMGAIPWAAFISESKAAPLVLRPPGALPEADFLRTCIRCGMCVEQCPYDTLRLAEPGEQKPLGTPYFIPREIPCYMCEDIPCVVTCPSGALDKSSVSSDTGEGWQLDINQARMGVAVIDTHSCIAYWGLQCDACYRVCPLMGTAITLKKERNERTGKHALLTPEVNGDICTGCGLCEHACVTKKASIRVLTRSVATGEVDTNYIKSWEQEDEFRLREASEDVTTHTERSAQAPVDYLNAEDLFEHDD